MESWECQKDKLYPLVNSAQSNPWRNTAGKWDTELTLSHLCLSRALMLTHRKGDNETETKESSKEKTNLLNLWVMGSREPSQGAPGSAGHRTGLPQCHRRCLPREAAAGLQEGLPGIPVSPLPALLRPPDLP